MPSQALGDWHSKKVPEFERLFDAHEAVGGDQRGRRWATRELNHAMTVAISARFQAFARELHIEATDRVLTDLVARQANPQLARVLQEGLSQDRRLDRFNPWPDFVAEDFKRFGFDIWADFGAHQWSQRKQSLAQVCKWRNAIAHDDFDINQDELRKLGSRRPEHLRSVREWWRDVGYLVPKMDDVVRSEISKLTDTPWV